MQTLNRGGLAGTALLTGLAVLCFAANSILCRLALAPGLIDPASFTSVRVLSAAAMLVAVLWWRDRRLPRLRYARPRSFASLFAYMILFSLGYVQVSAGTGALILIGGMQLTMFSVAMWEGERFPLLSWAGLAAAVAGLVYLVLPGIAAPDPLGAVMMAVSGAAFGLFSLFARGTDRPVEVNASNMACCIPPALLVNLLLLGELHGSVAGIALAVASGALATGLGYIVWYLALRTLPALLAATVQLSMPAVVALGGVALLAEPLTSRLLIASVGMLGGIAVVLLTRSRA